MRTLSIIYLLLRMAVMVILFALIVWIGDHPEKVGEWIAKYQKSQVTEFNKR